MQRVWCRQALLALSMMVFITWGYAEGASESSLHFTAPVSQTLQGTVDLEVSAPADTTAVRFFVDDTQLSELTDEYAVATKNAVVWHTVFDTQYFSSGTHLLRVVATTTGGTVDTSMSVHFTTLPLADSLDGAWRFAAAEDLPLGSMEGNQPAAVAPGFDDHAWTKIVVPDSLGAVDRRWSRASGLMGEYRRTFQITGQAGERELYLHSDSCFWACRYFVNGVEVGSSFGGYLPRRFRITQAIRRGTNSLAVVIDSRASTMGVFNRLRYYYWNYAGLLQDIRLEGFASVALTEFRAQGAADGTLTLYPSAVNTSGRDGQLTAKIDVYAPDERMVLSLTRKVTVSSAAGELEPIRLQIKDVKLWDLDHPNLYRVVVQTEGEHGSRELSETTGFRDIAVRDGDLLLNGKPVLGLQGFDRHGDYPGLGRTQPAGLADREMKQLHDKGFRIFRPAHYPTTKPELDAADKYGMLVLEEINVTGMSGEQLKSATMLDFAHSQLHRLIARDRSHPSIFAWSVGNENRTDQQGSDVYVRDVIGYGKTLDGTRPFTEVSAQLRSDICYSYMDFLAVNIYAGWYTDKLSDVVPELDALAAYAGNKPMVITEYGAEGVYNRPGTGKGTEYFQALTVDVHNRLLRNRPHFIGKMYWTSSEFIVGPKWDGGNPNPVPPFHTKGLLTYYRQPKLAWRVMFSPIEMEEIAPIEVGTVLPTENSVRVVIHNREQRPVAGHLVITPPAGASVSSTEEPFSLAAGGTAEVTFQLQVKEIVNKKNAEGTVRAIVDTDTEAMPQLLVVRSSCSSCKH